MTLELCDNIALLYSVAVLEMNIHLDSVVKQCEHTHCNINSRKHAVSLRYKICLGNIVLVNKQVGGAVNVVYILCYRSFYQIVNVKL